MIWRDRLEQLIWEQMLRNGGFVDLKMISAEFGDLFPGRFTMRWVDGALPLDYWANVSADDVVLEFVDDQAKTEWMLRWS